MVRPFDLRDLALIRRLGERGVSLHTVSALVENVHPLRGALISMLVGGEFPTFVWKPDNGERDGFLQLRVSHSGPQAFVLYISPRCDSAAVHDAHVAHEGANGDLGALPGTGHSTAGGAWLALLDEAVAEIGRRGIHHLIAETDEHGPELPLLRRAGFAVYTRQDIWSVAAADYRPQGVAARKLQRRHAADDWDVQLLYANTVPRLVQLVEPTPLISEGENWVLRAGDELAAFVTLRQGPTAGWLRFFIHPDAESEADEIVSAALAVAFERESERVYCCVRRYESWLPSALSRSGFTISASQAVMVRHTVHYASRPVPETAVALDGQRIPVSSPMVRQLRRRHPNGHK
ncbi:MAG: hypothetical protein K1X50_17670 [Candidatus Promineofilum sp.]|nr:hypothetical protein [Promineifilum sp.]MCW5862045.1 hypothetical protein [Anaerolineae bacterium]